MKFLRSKLRLIFIVLILIILAGVSWLFLSSSHLSSSSSFNPQPKLSHLRSTDNHTNFLFLGIGGQNHQAPDLTDSIVLISFNHQNGHLILIPLPRDIWLDSYQAKLNTLYHYAKQTDPQHSLDKTKQMFSQIIDLPIHYLAIIDFQGFVRLIDAVGGIDVEVKRSFDDYKYPIPGKENAEPVSARYQHLHFDQGWQHFDGQLALKFARSRHALGPEGSDFARSQRQEQIIKALLQKLISPSVLTNPSILPQLKQEFNRDLITNIPLTALPDLAYLALNLKRHPDNLKTASLTNLLVDFHRPPFYQGQWVLLPKTNWQTIHAYLKQTLNQ